MVIGILVKHLKSIEKQSPKALKDLVFKTKALVEKYPDIEEFQKAWNYLSKALQKLKTK